MSARAVALRLAVSSCRVAVRQSGLRVQLPSSPLAIKTPVKAVFVGDGRLRLVGRF